MVDAVLDTDSFFSASSEVGKAVGTTFGEIVDNESLDVVLVLHASKPPSQELVEAAELELEQMLCRGHIHLQPHIHTHTVVHTLQ